VLFRTRDLQREEIMSWIAMPLMLDLSRHLYDHEAVISQA
jgi:hypothetical protein